MKTSWNANLYDTKHGFVSKYGNELVDLLAPVAGERILDLGCGTGDLAKRLTELEVEVVGVDQSESMVQQAKAKYPEIAFEVQDATKLPYDNEFDAVFSNAVLHWVKEPEQALAGIYRSLKPGGRFVAEFGGKDNVQAIISAIISQLPEFAANQFPWYYPSIGEYATLMETAGFRVTFACHFDRPTPLDGENGLRNWIDMFAGSFFEGISTEQQAFIIEKVEEQLKPVLFVDGKWIADYKRLRVVGIK
ncbi:methyltransferase domain-containing protein [Bacillus sp. AGMB 02131]|uniref:Methyltransferase domain-containing protein n=1 Tax=Peribacillus faecalis TaxID=2772559 RepID=A0A927CUY4_9BACI|nr:class I SAM-dependent methyltransferase [Peribacillus faecalis]MBD3107941.1 methyltransferase domain-containing protein [Peribacillus faecalis]